MFNLDVGKLSGYKTLIYLFTVVSLIIPGIGYIYITNKGLFGDIETTKLILLSIFYSFPLYLFGFMGAIGDLKIDPPKKAQKKIKDRELIMMWGASVISIFSFYAVILGLFYIYLVSNTPVFSNLTWNSYMLPFVYLFGSIFSLSMVLSALIKANSQKIIKRINRAKVSISKFIEKLRKKRKTP